MIVTARFLLLSTQCVDGVWTQAATTRLSRVSLRGFLSRSLVRAVVLWARSSQPATPDAVTRPTLWSPQQFAVVPKRGAHRPDSLGSSALAEMCRAAWRRPRSGRATPVVRPVHGVQGTRRIGSGFAARPAGPSALSGVAAFGVPAGAAWSSWCCPGKTAKPELKTALRGSLLANGPKVVSTPPGASAGGPDTHVSWARTDVQAGQGPRRQSLRLPREPLLPTQTPDQLHHPREGRPGSQPQEARLPRRTTTEVRQERLHLRRMPSSVSEYSTRGGTSS